MYLLLYFACCLYSVLLLLNNHYKPDYGCNLSFRRRHLVMLKCAKTLWQPGLCPGPCWGSSQRSPDPLAGGEGLAAPSPRTPPPLSALRASHHPPPPLGISIFRSWQLCDSQQCCATMLVNGWLVGWGLMALSAQTGYIVPYTGKLTACCFHLRKWQPILCAQGLYFDSSPLYFCYTCAV